MASDTPPNVTDPDTSEGFAWFDTTVDGHVEGEGGPTRDRRGVRGPRIDAEGNPSNGGEFVYVVTHTPPAP